MCVRPTQDFTMNENEDSESQAGLEAPEVEDRREVGHGFVFAALAVVAAQILLILISPLWQVLGLDSEEDHLNLGPALVWFAVGWTQLLYLPALAYYFDRKGEPEVRNGVLITSAVLFVVTSLCFGTLAG